MSDTPRTEADFAKILYEAFMRGEEYWRLADSKSYADNRLSYEKTEEYGKWRDAKARELAAVIADRDAEIVRLNSLFSSAVDVADEHRAKADTPRTDAEWKAADRRKRINDLAARYAGQLAFSYDLDDPDQTPLRVYRRIVKHARAIATEIVEAEE